jgi:hypothetical protein
MQTFSSITRFFKAVALCLSIVLVSQSLSAQTASVQEKYSAMVVKMATSENGPSFDAIVIPDSSESKFILIVENPLKNKIQVRLIHPFHGEAFRKETREESYRNRFDLTDAEDGVYILEISSGKERIRKQIQINTLTNISRKIIMD